MYTNTERSDRIYTYFILVEQHKMNKMSFYQHTAKLRRYFSRQNDHPPQTNQGFPTPGLFHILISHIECARVIGKHCFFLTPTFVNSSLRIALQLFPLMYQWWGPTLEFLCFHFPSLNSFCLVSVFGLISLSSQTLPLTHSMITVVISSFLY